MAEVSVEAGLGGLGFRDLQRVRAEGLGRCVSEPAVPKLLNRNPTKSHPANSKPDFWTPKDRNSTFNASFSTLKGMGRA